MTVSIAQLWKMHNLAWEALGGPLSCHKSFRFCSPLTNTLPNYKYTVFIWNQRHQQASAYFITLYIRLFVLSGWHYLGTWLRMDVSLPSMMLIKVRYNLGGYSVNIDLISGNWGKTNVNFARTSQNWFKFLITSMVWLCTWVQFWVKIC